MAAWKATGQMPEALANAPEMPDGCRDVWDTFLSLHAARGGSGYGPLPISYTEMDAYQRLSGIRLRPWEVSCIRSADAAYLSIAARK